LAVLALLTAAVPAAAAPPVPRNFHGVFAQRPPTASDIARMQAAGVGAIRFPISWQASEQPRGTFHWEASDAYMEAIAEVGAEPLPILFAKPGWVPADASGQPMSTPAARAAWADFCEAVARRYGPGGTFVAEHPGVPPLETWQLWNEPNLRSFWGADPDPAQYATLAEIGSEAIRGVDPEAKIMLAGLAPARRGYKPWQFLEASLPDIDPGTFDIVAIHPYGETIKDVRAQIADARREMAQAGYGGLPLAVTEIGWGSNRSAGRTAAGSLRAQARNLREVYSDLASRRSFQVSQVFWFSWRDLPAEISGCGFCASSGLLRANGRPKPALDAFAASARQLR
jgi:hypothetical protein